MILSRFFKPKWQHANPHVRLQALEALADTDPVLVELARQDSDPAVRRAALTRLDDPSLLEEVLARDSDDQLRTFARQRLAELLFTPRASALDPQRSLELLEGLDEARLAELVRASGQAVLRRTALERVRDEALLADLAVSAPSTELRLAALARVQGEALVEQVAQGSRNRDKRVHRQARERLDALAQTRARRAKAEELCREVEVLAGEQTHKPDMGRLAVLERDWERLESPDADLAQRYRGAVEQVRARFSSLSAERGERLTLIQELEALLEGKAQDGATLTATLERVQTAWQAAGPADRGEQEHFNGLVAAVRRRHERLSRDQERVTALEKLLEQGQKLLEQTSEIGDSDRERLARQWQSAAKPDDKARTEELQRAFEGLQDKLRARLERQARVHDQELAEIQSLVEQLDRALTQGALQQALSFRDQARARLKANIALSRGEMSELDRTLNAFEPRIGELRGWRRWGTFQAREHLCEEAEALVASVEAQEPPTLAARVKQLRATWKALDGSEGAAPRPLWERFNAACEQAYAPAQAWFQAQAVERQENLAARETLCEELERFAAQTDWQNVDWREADRFRRQAHNRWLQLGPVNRAERKGVDRRYRQALKGVDQQLEGERQRDWARRQRLVERVRGLVELEDLNQAIEGAKQAQGEWSPTVLSPRSKEQALWREFRSACDDIFARRQAQFQAQDAERQANLEQKEALCGELEALIGQDDATVLGAFHRVQEIEDQWEATGPAPRESFRTVQRRFGEAREAYLERHRQAERNRARNALLALRQRERLVHALEVALAEGEADLQSARTRWQELPPLTRGLGAGLEGRFKATVKALEAGPEAARRLAAALADHLAAAKILCLRMEILADAETPEAFAQERLEYQVSRLSESLTSRTTEPTERDILDRTRELALEWHALGVLPDHWWQTLVARFETAQDALLARED